MAKTTKKQQQRALKKQKARADKRRQLRHANRAAPGEFDLMPLDDLPTQPETAEQALRRSVQTFGYQPRFATDAEKAIALFFGENELETATLVFDEAETADFQEWYLSDFVTANGRRVIDLFAEEQGAALPPEQRQMLQDWIATNRLRLFEVQSVSPGAGETVKDLLSGAVLHCSDISISHAARRWSILLARPLLTQGSWHFTGAGQIFSPLEKDKLVGFARKLWNDYQQQNPQATLDEFYRDRSLQLRKFAAEMREAVESPIYLTAEHHPIVMATAEYQVRDWYQTAQRLNAAEEFVHTGDSLEKPGGQHYVWLQRGRSHVPKAAPADERAIELRSEWTLGPGHPSFLTLGDMTVSVTTLELACTSRERLAAGRQLLEEVLEGEITHRADHFADFDTGVASDASAPAAQTPKLMDAESRLVQNELLGREMKKWLNEPIPALDHQTPRQAATTPAGRAALEELLKVMAYLEEGDPGRSETPFSVQAIRRELGLEESGRR